jgi:hypothetical protein
MAEETTEREREEWLLAVLRGLNDRFAAQRAKPMPRGPKGATL